MICASPDRPVCNPRFLVPAICAQDGGFTGWHYRSAAPLADVLADGYFDALATAQGAAFGKKLAFGDVIFVRAGDAIATLAVIEVRASRVLVAPMGEPAHLPVRGARSVADATVEAASGEA